MRGLVPALLAGLVALTAPALPAAAIYVENGELPLVRLDLEVRDRDCPGGAALCVVDLTGNLSSVSDAMRVDLHVANRAADAAAAELFATQRVYDATADGKDSPGEGERVAPELLAHLDLAPGEEKSQEVVIRQGTGLVRVQATTGGAEAELDREVPIRYTILADQSAEDMADDSGPAQPDAQPPQPENGGKDAPALPLAGLVLACALAVLVARRVR
jgi:hypothetical protein